jgi:class 3 adenylate cyclase/HAMP domain-containing protein
MSRLWRSSLVAGSLTGVATSALILAMFFLYDQLVILWPVAFVPVFITGVIALRRAGVAVRSPREAALAGAIAGVAAALISSAVILMEALWAQNNADFGSINASAYWTLLPILQAGPFFVPRDRLFFDLPFSMPSWWAYRNAVTGAHQMPWTVAAFVPLGIALSAAQGWLVHFLTTSAAVGERLVSTVARAQRTFGSKLRIGFAVLIAMVFVVGWLGFGSTEEMHTRLHTGRALQHWRDHIASVEANLATQTTALGRLGSAPDPAALQQIGVIGQRVATELVHMRTLPPPRHTDPAAGRENMTMVAELSLPRVTEAEIAFRSETAAITAVLDLYRAGKATDAQAAITGIAPARSAVDLPLQQLDVTLQKEIKDWLAGADSETHAQQIFMMLIVLAATGIAFPLGYVFSQVVVRPVIAVDHGLERIAHGDFAQSVRVENRDELGQLATRVNATGSELERLYGELRGLNESLQQRVQGAVREIERSRLLRRYLPHQVADQVIASGDESLLRSHRREITVVFGDLRGFTAFSETAEPEVVMGVLREYHGAVGDLISRYSGTLEHFAGDGWMVYFNDPLPVPDHAGQAVRMAVAMRERVGELSRQWRKLGFELDFGIGIAIGYATLGAIGFEGRQDYGAVGAVTNLAARLSTEAKAGQILVTQRVHALVEDRIDAEPAGEVVLKGFVKPVVAYNVVAARAAVPAAD